MRAITSSILLLAVAVLVTPVGLTRAEPIPVRIVAQGFPPLQWENAGKPDGYVTDIVYEALNRVNKEVPVTIASFEFVPWKRAMLMAQTVPNVLFFSISRTPEREYSFLWLGEVSPYGQYFFQRKGGHKIAAATIEDLRQPGYRIGVQDGSNLHVYLKEKGFEETGNLVPITDYHQGIEMLYLDRIDLLPLTGFLAKASACKQGFDGDALEPVLFIEDLANPLWAVFSPGSDPQLVDAFRQALAGLRSEGFLQEHLDRHKDAWERAACGH